MALANIAIHMRRKLNLPHNEAILATYEVAEISLSDHSVWRPGIFAVFRSCIAFLPRDDPYSVPVHLAMNVIHYIGQQSPCNGNVDIGFQLPNPLPDQPPRKVRYSYRTPLLIDREIIALVEFVRSYDHKLLDAYMMDFVKLHGFEKSYIQQLAKYFTQHATLLQYQLQTIIGIQHVAELLNSEDDALTQQLHTLGYKGRLECVIGNFTVASVLAKRGTATVESYKDVNVILTRNYIVLATGDKNLNLQFEHVMGIYMVPNGRNPADRAISVAHLDPESPSLISYVLSSVECNALDAAAVLIEDAWLRYLNCEYNVGEPQRADRCCLHVDELRGFWRCFQGMDEKRTGAIPVGRFLGELQRAIADGELALQVIYGGFGPVENEQIVFRYFLVAMRTLLAGSITEQAGYLVRVIDSLHSNCIYDENYYNFMNKYMTLLDVPDRQPAHVVREVLMQYSQEADWGPYVDLNDAASVFKSMDDPALNTAMLYLRLRHSMTEVRPQAARSLVFPGHRMWGLSLHLLRGISLCVELPRSDLNTPKTAYKSKTRFDMVTQRVIFKDMYSKLKRANPPGWMVVTEYAAETFREIRYVYGWNNDEVIKSIGFRNVASGFVSGRARTLVDVPSPMKSSDFVFMSHDERLVIRSLSDIESIGFRSTLQPYHEYVLANRDTLLVKVLGLYSLQCEVLPGKKIIFVVMTNPMMPPRKQFHEIFALKASVPYSVSKVAPSNGNDLGPRIPLAERSPCIALDIKEFGNRCVTTAPLVRESILRAVQEDCSFLCKIGVIEYKLLCAFHTVHYDNNTIESERVADEMSPFAYDILEKLEKEEMTAADRAEQERLRKLAEEEERNKRRLPKFEGPLPAWRCQACQTVNPMHNDVMCKHCYAKSPNLEELNSFWAARSKKEEVRMGAFARLSKLSDVPTYKVEDDGATRYRARQPDMNDESTESEDEVEDTTHTRVDYEPRTAAWERAGKSGAAAEEAEALAKRLAIPVDGPVSTKLMRHEAFYKRALDNSSAMAGRAAVASSGGVYRSKFQRFFGGLPALMHHSTNPAVIPPDMDYDDIVFLGIIDIFTKFGARKRTFLGISFGNRASNSLDDKKQKQNDAAAAADAIPSIPPDDYRKNFMSIVSAVFR